MNCPNCGRELPEEQQIYGLTYRPPCPCQEEARKIIRQEEILRGQCQLEEAYMRLSGVSERYRGADLNSIQPQDGQEEAIEACWDLVGKLRGNTGVMLVGGVGSGKTMIASGTVIRLLKNQARRAGDDFKRNFAWGGNVLDHLLHPSALMVSTVELFSQLKACFDGRGSADAVLHKYKAVPLLVLDDLGAESSKDWGMGQIFEIIDRRYNECLPTLITTNLLPKEIGNRMGERTADRLREMCRVVNITTASQRKTAE